MATPAELKFVEDMIPHHQMAVEMATEVLQSGGADQFVTTLANAILVAQQDEIAEMTDWFEANAGAANAGWAEGMRQTGPMKDM